MDSNQVGAKAETNAVAARPVQSGYQSGRELIDFLNRTVTLFSSLDTYAALAAHDIVPSTTRVYDLRAIEGALTQVTGQEVVVRCRYRKLTEVWYSFNVKGSLQTGDFVPAEPVGKQGRGGCPKRGIRYLPKRPTT